MSARTLFLPACFIAGAIFLFLCFDGGERKAAAPGLPASGSSVSGTGRTPGVERLEGAGSPSGGRSSAQPESLAAKTELPVPEPAPVLSAASNASSREKISAFSKWARRYLAAAPEERSALLPEGRSLAAARQPAYHELIRSNPREAIAQAVPMVARQQLPGEITSLLESRVNERGTLVTYMSIPPLDGAPGEQPPALRYAKLTDGRALLAHVYGRRAEAPGFLENISFIGVAMGRDLAVDERPLRPLEVGEIPDAAKEAVNVCPVSGKETALPHADEQADDDSSAARAITAATPAVEADGRVVYLCDGSHTAVYEQLLIQGEGSSGGAVPVSGDLPHATTKALGVLRILYIPITFPDQNESQASEATCYDVMRRVSDYLHQSSFGKLTVITSVTPLVMLPRTEAWYIAKDEEVDGLGLEHSDAREGARRLGYDPALFDTVVVRLKGGPRATGGWGGGNSVWTYFDSDTIVAHEVGHTFGLAHANFWDTSGESAIGAGENEEYGDRYDVMGGGSVPRAHYNVKAKNQIGWLREENLHRVATSGVYRLHAMDRNVLDPAHRYALRVRKDADRTYWGELRQRYDDAVEPWVQNGLVLSWNYPGGSGSNAQLIDTTPGTPDAKKDGAITVGRTFSDTEADIHFTPLQIIAGTPRAVDVAVNIGPFPGNQRPVLSIGASAPSVAAGGSITFTATASDPDGDVLAYHWTSYDANIFPNAAQVTRTFTTAGRYLMACTVSDMKGMTVTRQITVTAGSSSTFNMSGRITLNGQPLPGVLVDAASSPYGMTDVNGDFIIPGKTAATRTLTPKLYGFTFTPASASVTVGPDAANVNFTAAETTRVMLTAPVATAAEGGAGGRFTLTRTGSTSAELLVMLAGLSGSAAASDYTLTPAPDEDILTIPAGQASLDVTVAAVNDTAAEGPEPLRLELIGDPAYLISGPAAATVTIADNDSSLPLVSVTAVQPLAEESTGRAAVFEFRRTGSTAGALNVIYTVSGNAAPGPDCSAFPGAFSIPAGSAAAQLQLVPVNDTANEGAETLTLTLTSSAVLLAASDANSATATIIDDDVQTIRVTAPDAEARETPAASPPDTGTFVLTRAGDLSNPLTVWYSLAGTALHGPDYDVLPGQVTFPSGQSTAAVTVRPVPDELGEADETVQLIVASLGSSYQIGDTSPAVITIHDGAADVPTVELQNSDDGAEPSNTASFTITLKGSRPGTVTVNYTVGGTATPGADYQALSGSVQLDASGTNTATILITPVNDAGAENLESIVLTLTPNAAYRIWQPSSTATNWLRDDDRATVYADAHRDQPSEPGTASSFYISRTGDITGALTVNFTLSGTATQGTDYQTAGSSIIIPANAAGADVSIVPMDDALAEGRETVIMTLGAGSYGLGNTSAQLLLRDDETAPRSVQFTSAGGGGSESAGTVQVPVSLSASSSQPVTVNYSIGTGAGAAVSTTASGATAPWWVRVVRNGNSFTSFTSPDGATWTQLGAAQTMSMASASYRAGLGVCAYSGSQICTAVFDNVSITGLSAGGAQGAKASQDIGNPAPAAGSDSLTGGIYTVNGGGTDVDGTNDSFRFVYFPVTNSTACTITARVVSMTNTDVDATAGVMIRETGNTNSRYQFCAATPASGLGSLWRLTNGGQNAGTFSTFALPYWVRLQRLGGVITAFRSADGVSWQQQDQPVSVPLGDPVMAGLAVCSHNDGTLCTGIFDNVTVNGSSPGLLEGRNVGEVALPGSAARTAVSASGDTWNVQGSGADLEGGNDECYLASRQFSGDFTISARVVSLTNTSSSAVGGVMIREAAASNARHVFMGMRPGGTAELIRRLSGATTATGSAVDFILKEGTLTFDPGETLKSVPLTIIDDLWHEDAEALTITLRDSAGAELGAQNQFTWAINDNDTAPALPWIGFAGSVISASENAESAPLLVTLSSPSGSAVSVNYAVAGGTAGAADYTLTNGVLTFAPGETAKVIPHVILDDAVAENDDTVLLSLSAPSGAVLGGNASATLVILNDDGMPAALIINPSAAALHVPAGMGLVLAAQTQNLGPAPVTAWTHVSGPAAAVFGAAGGLTNSVTFPQSGIYVLRCTAANGDVSAFSDLRVSYGVFAPAFTSGAAGAVSPAPSFTQNGGQYTLTSAGAGIPSSGAADGFLFLRLKIDGDAEISARITSVQNVNGSSSRAGVMFRESVTADSTGAFMGVTAASATRFIWRADEGENSDSADGSGGVPRWVRLRRAGELFTGETAPDISGSPGAWTAVGSQTVSTTLDLHAGLAASSGSTGAAGSAIFDNVKIQLGANSAPLFNLPASLSTATGSVSIAAPAVTDDSRPLPVARTHLWAKVSGPGTVNFSAPLAAATNATLSVPGQYVLRLAVSDGQAASFDDVTVTYTGALPPIEVWRQAQFGAEAGNAAIAGNNADFDLDGLTNLMEYALALDPKASSSHELPFAGITGGFLTLTYRKNLAATDVTCTVEGSAALSGWSAAAVTEEIVSDNGAVRVIRAKTAIQPGDARKYLRLTVTAP